MTITNHALTGALIGLLVGEPLVALPTALASHFVCDALPHYGSRLQGAALFRSGGFKTYLVTDASLSVALVAALAITQPKHWLLAAICAFLATSPDLVWLKLYLKAQQHKKWKPNLFERFAGGIQWFERPIGGVVEAAWLVAALVVLTPFL